ncbi:MAG: Protein of unknown function (DUF3181) [Phormidesmis priestleyi Ana]|uniref:Thylakoid-associated protein n=1 Tax=Phormidesmis priestleyi Ana TaxID=1666911 RepID=A0A0P7Z064_9CYAN|nr:MAG: Protein of unknown function (DUF3181) [Phormidesmis priestleyi Ana]
MASSASAETLEALAAEIGENIYMDIAKWHLYLGVANLHTPLAERLLPMVSANKISEEGVIQVLRDIPIKLGGGRKTLPLSDLLPMQCQVNLIDLLEEYQRKL